ncbi:MAG: hypothetical protein LBU15_00345 [Rickettsiales bacterium]|jgi:hypothetical protein|nr:hypothetical protein [Rickettsiales bacterium]
MYEDNSNDSKRTRKESPIVSTETPIETPIETLDLLPEFFEGLKEIDLLEGLEPLGDNRVKTGTLPPEGIAGIRDPLSQKAKNASADLMKPGGRISNENKEREKGWSKGIGGL